MAKTEFEKRLDEIDANLGVDKKSKFNSDRFRNLYENGVESLNLNSSSRKGGELVVPNQRLAALWRLFFKVQLTDGGWRDQEGYQLEHPFAYSGAAITINTSRTTPTFESYTTHEKINSPIDHFDVIPSRYTDMVYVVQLLTGDDSYTESDLKADLKKFEQMEYSLADKENCSRCNPDIY